MFLYRIAKRKYISDLSGEGARIYGGRWNKKGTNLLYTSENRSLATVEYLVHIPMSMIPRDICIAQIVLPKEISVRKIDLKDLPANWAEYPAPSTLSVIIENTIKENEVCAIKVPSAIISGEWNILLNPRSSDFSQITIADVSDYSFDERLLRR